MNRYIFLTVISWAPVVLFSRCCQSFTLNTQSIFDILQWVNFTNNTQVMTLRVLFIQIKLSVTFIRRNIDIKVFVSKFFHLPTQQLVLLCILFVLGLRVYFVNSNWLVMYMYM